MNLNLLWSVPTPNPNCGFKALYRRKSDPSYTELDISGSTISGSTISITTPANYEGDIVSNCCSDNLSLGSPFGVNAYVLLNSSALLQSTLGLVLSSIYSNSYDTLVNGNVVVILNDESHFNVPFSVTYGAGNKTQTYSLGVVSQSQSILSTNITTISPIFNGGGQLQQLDIVNTPPYFSFYSASEISGSSWAGAPTQLPSFTLDGFNVTELDVDGVTVLSGNLIMSYILSQVYDNTSGSTDVLIEIIDQSNQVVIGSTFSNTSPVGLRNVTISLTKSVTTLDSSSQFKMRTFWPNGILIDTKVFYFPSS